MVPRATLELNAEQERAVLSEMNRVVKLPSYHYPWRVLEADLEQDQRNTLPLLAYGSLVNASSAARTLSADRRVPAVAFGVRRIFNYVMSESISQFGRAPNPFARAVLNVIVTGRLEDMANGIVIEVPLTDIPALRSREVGYDLVPIACIDWRWKDNPPFPAYILRCPDEPRDGKVRTNAHIEPHPEYYRLARAGAAEFGEDFLRFWLSTTYLADGETPVVRWEATAFPASED